MNTISDKPPAPSSVAYALTVPQSVLFADLSLRGNRRETFDRVFGIDYEPNYIEIDNGAMAWDYTSEEPFVGLLADGLDAPAALERFVEGMGRTAREVDKLSYVLSAVIPTSTDRAGLRSLLTEYWDAYELQMTNLFTYWNVGTALSQLLTNELTALGLSTEVAGGFPRFMIPSEPNYFLRERANRERIKWAILSGRPVPDSLSDANDDLIAALEAHAAHYGFLLAPFNLGSPPGAGEVLSSLSLGDATEAAFAEPPVLDDLPPSVRRIARLSQEFTFWKSERLDVMALADARMLPHYRVAAEFLGCSVEAIFALTRDELDDALVSGSLPSDSTELLKRSENYCLVLVDGVIRFCTPSPRRGEVQSEEAQVGTVLKGAPASAGTASGVVRVVRSLDDLDRVEAGDILVTPMTRPEYGVALDNAAAFVTDEGSRHCHAAIIAREMRKPCVISTETATAVLRDGMGVLVDGTRGTVEITTSPSGETD